MQNIIKQFHTTWKLCPYLWPKDWHIRARFLCAIFLVISTILLNMATPLFLRKAVDAMSAPSSVVMTAEVLLLAYGMMWLVSKITLQLRMLVMYRVVERGIHLLSLSAFNQLMYLSPRYHTERKTGAVLNAIDRAQQGLPGLFWGLFFIVIPTLIELFVASGIIFFLYGFTYALILALVLISYLLFTTFGTEWALISQNDANKKSAHASAGIVDSLLNYEAIRYFGNQDHESNKCQQLLMERENAWTKQHVRGELIFIGQGLIIGAGFLLLTWLSGMKVMSGLLPISAFIVINGYLLQFATPLSHFGFILRAMNEGASSINDVISILEEKADIEDAVSAKPLVLRKGHIVFDNITFGYDPARPILENISFEIPAGKTVAIVGPSGAGKSTIVKLLFRFYEPAEGRILIDGQEIREVTQGSLQKAIGLVPQHTPLFNDSLYHNLMYGSLNASSSELEEIIASSHLAALIKALPEGLETVVGEHGAKLSGGEKQRIAIARVLLKKPAIYIFDEATSSLDTKTERSIQQNIEEISENATTLIIAHRLSTVTHADCIFVLDNGQLIEQGEHTELLQKDGLYASLWYKQVGSSVIQEKA